MKQTKSYSSPRAVPRVPYCPTLRAASTACRPPEVCCSEEIEKRVAAPLVGEQLRDLVRSLPRVEPGSILVSSKTVAHRVAFAPCWRFMNFHPHTSVATWCSAQYRGGRE